MESVQGLNQNHRSISRLEPEMPEKVSYMDRITLSELLNKSQYLIFSKLSCSLRCKLTFSYGFLYQNEWLIRVL
jgi:hypothetical protein